MISPYRVTYNSFSSEDFDLICDVAFDSDSGATSSFLSREAVASETYRGAIKRVSSYKYTESFAPVITFVDKNFSDFTMERQRQILKWLTSKDTPSFLNVYHDDSNAVSYAILGAFTECETYKLGNGRVVGFQCTFESIMPYALSDLESKSKAMSESALKPINIDTDDNQPVYPRITIQQNSSVSVVEVDHAMTDDDEWLEGTVYYYSAKNMYYWIDSKGEKHDSPTNTSGIETTSVVIRNTHKIGDKIMGVYETFVKNNIKGETIVLDGANRIVSSSRSTGRVFGDDFDWQWIPLYEGTNELTFIGNCTATVEYRTPVKCGEF